MSDELQLLTVQDAAARLACSQGLVRKLITRGMLTPCRVAGAVRISTSELGRFIAAGEGRTADGEQAVPASPRSRGRRVPAAAVQLTKDAFLGALRQGMPVQAAAKSAACSLSTLYRWRGEDPAFGQAWSGICEQS